MPKPLAALATVAALLLTPPAAAAGPLKVVASFSIIGDFARAVGGERIALTTLVGPDGDVHVYEPRPSDAAAVAAADVVLVNGLGFEGFLPRLVEASGTGATVVELSRGTAPLGGTAEDRGDADGHGHGGTDPHAFQSVPNAGTYVANIVDAFCAADAAGCPSYRANGAAYAAELDVLHAEIRAAVASLPPDRRTIITSHDAFGHFAREYGLALLAPERMTTEAEPTAADVAALIRQIREAGAAALFVENVADPRLIEQIAAETGIAIGGRLYSDALSPPDGPAPSYLALMRHNVRTIVDAAAAR